jgi:hypothetical protein
MHIEDQQTQALLERVMCAAQGYWWSSAPDFNVICNAATRDVTWGIYSSQHPTVSDEKWMRGLLTTCQPMRYDCIDS